MIIVIFFISYFFTFQLLKTDISNEEFIRMILSQNNPNVEYEYHTGNILLKITNFISNIDLRNPFTIIKSHKNLQTNLPV